MTRSVASAVDCSNSPEKRVETYQQLFYLFKQRSAVLYSNGVIKESGKMQVSTTTPTSDNVLKALKRQEERRAEELESRKQAQQVRGQRDIFEKSIYTKESSTEILGSKRQTNRPLEA